MTVPSVDRSRLDDLGRADPEITRQLRAQLPADVAHRVEVDDAVAVDPLEDLAGMEAGMADGFQRRFEGGNVELGDVRAEIGLHGDPPWRGKDIQCHYALNRSADGGAGPAARLKLLIPFIFRHLRRRFVRRGRLRR